ncbi:MAG: hypothetical protein HY730_07995, partial [Candidatus Tectomicrobia bacterium]|nr:hypothetical protein [Candidatus Tectomicrobia bacterium]
MTIEKNKAANYPSLFSGWFFARLLRQMTKNIGNFHSISWKEFHLKPGKYLVKKELGRENSRYEGLGSIYGKIRKGIFLNSIIFSHAVIGKERHGFY